MTSYAGWQSKQIPGFQDPLLFSLEALQDLDFAVRLVFSIESPGDLPAPLPLRLQQKHISLVNVPPAMSI